MKLGFGEHSTNMSLLQTVMNPVQTKVTLLLFQVADGGNNHRFAWCYKDSSEMKARVKDNTGQEFLTHGTTEEGLHFVFVLQLVPHAGKHVQ